LDGFRGKSWRIECHGFLDFVSSLMFCRHRTICIPAPSTRTSARIAFLLSDIVAGGVFISGEPDVMEQEIEMLIMV